MPRNIEYRDFEYKDVDAETLHADIKAELGDKFYGVSTSTETYKFAPDGVTIIETIPARVILHFDDAVTGTEISKARQKYDAHDKASLPPKPPKKTPEEQIAELAARIEALEAQGNGQAQGGGR